MKPKSKISDVVGVMPRLSHHPDKTKPFDIHKSDVVTWLIIQPEVKQWLFNKMRGRWLIRYDASAGVWEGCKTFKYDPAGSGQREAGFDRPGAS